MKTSSKSAGIILLRVISKGIAESRTYNKNNIRAKNIKRTTNSFQSSCCEIIKSRSRNGGSSFMLFEKVCKPNVRCF